MDHWIFIGNFLKHRSYANDIVWKRFLVDIWWKLVWSYICELFLQQIVMREEPNEKKIAFSWFFLLVTQKPLHQIECFTPKWQFKKLFCNASFLVKQTNNRIMVYALKCLKWKNIKLKCFLEDWVIAIHLFTSFHIFKFPAYCSREIFS